MTRELNLSAGIETAWAAFRRVLADRIAQRDDLDLVLFELDVPERHETPCGPYIQVSWSEGDEVVIAEVSSNRVLDPKFKIRKAERQLLRGAGWQRPDAEQDNYWYAFEIAYADQAATMLVDALRDVFGVIHPTFLADRFAEEVAAAEAELDGDAGQVAEPEPSLPETVTPTDPEHLTELIDVALGADWGRPPPRRDEDGDIPYVCDSAVVFVRTLEGVPMIRIFSELVLEVTDHDAAAFEVNVLNRDQGSVKFVLVGNVVKMSLDVPALPLVPYHLRSALSMMCELAPRLDADLAHRVGGRPFLLTTEDEAA